LPHKLIFITHTLPKQDFHTIKQTPDEAANKKIEDIKTKLENMNPPQRNFMLEAINQLSEGSETVNILLPSEDMWKAQISRKVKVPWKEDEVRPPATF
jgi:hypothetical protein